MKYTSDQLREIHRLQELFGMTFNQVIREYDIKEIDQSCNDIRLNQEQYQFSGLKTQEKIFKGHKHIKHSPKSLTRQRPQTHSKTKYKERWNRLIDDFEITIKKGKPKEYITKKIV